MRHRTQVAIIGSGPAGLLLSHLLRGAGIESIVVDRASRAHILGRVRAGVLESGTAEVLENAGLGARLRQEGLDHGGFALAFGGQNLRIDLERLAGAGVTVYGQTEVTRDLMDARPEDAPAFYEAEDAKPHDFDTDRPFVTLRHGGSEHRIDCEIVAGCDGYHGPSRAAVPDGALATYERLYPFGWMGVLADVPPAADELIYARHERGFALCSMRSATRSRYYVQCALEDRPDAWPDDRFWDELRRRLPETVADAVTPGPSFEKSIAPLRSFVAEPLRFGRLFLAGDAAHIVPPTGAKGLNLAVGDVRYLFEALRAFFIEGDAAGLDTYSPRALARAWKAVRFSWWMTTLLHWFPDDGPFDRRVREAELNYLAGSEAAQTVLAENYIGLPY